MTLNLIGGGQSKWHANQVGSSAEMLERMIADALRAGETYDALAHAAEVEKIVRLEVIGTEHAVRLMLLAAMLLDSGSGAAGDEYGRKCALLVSNIATFCESLQGSPVKWASERFAARVQLNQGNVERARTLANRIERRITRLAGGAGKPFVEIPDERDEAGVSPETWLLLAEVALCEREFSEARRALEMARGRWSAAPVAEEDAAMYELLAALSSFGAGEGEGLAALAFLYSRHHLQGGSSLGPQTLSRIAAAAGYVEHANGIGALEVERWRRLGPPEREAVEAFVGCGVRPERPAGLRLDEREEEELLGFVNGLGADSGAIAGRAAHEDALRGREEYFPLEFELSEHRLDSVTGMFDADRKTGPLVIDWSRCGREVVEEAVRDGAVFEGALVAGSGTIYFNEGAYVDAVFNTDDAALLSLAPAEVIVELHRVGMARLPKSRGLQTACGSEAAHSPARINARPNHFNIEVLRRIDLINALRRGDPVPQEEEDEGDALGGWDSLGSGAAVATIPAVVLDPLSRLMCAETLTDVCQSVSNALAGMVGGDVRVEITAEDESAPLAFSGARPGEDLAWSVKEAGTLKLRVGLSKTSRDPEAVRFVLDSAACRVRLMPGGRHRAPAATVPGFIAVDEKTLQLLEEVRIFARMDGTTDDKSRALRHILITGERGTGKEEVARLIHKLSGRADRKYVTADSGVLNNPDQVAAELFGARDGAYTGTRGDRKGLVQEAEGGSLFFDEIDEGVTVQSVLKRFAQFGTFKTLGSAAAAAADVRLIIATNRISGGEALIKEDLRDRFWEIRVPPLRERRADIRPLAEFFAHDIREYVLPATVLAWLETLDWPGNVRQLRHTVERACSLADDPARDLTLELFEECVERNGGKSLIRMVSDTAEFVPLREGETLKERLLAHEREYIIAALKSTGLNKARAAALLGFRDRQGLYPRLKACSVSDAEVLRGADID